MSLAAGLHHLLIKYDDGLLLGCLVNAYFEQYHNNITNSLCHMKTFSEMNIF